MSASVDGRSARLRIALSPEPMPKNARPGAISSIVAMPDAATAGCRVIGFVTLGPMRTRRVACAHSAIVAYISRKTDWLSATPTIEKPTSSARRASATAVVTDRGKQSRPRRAVVISREYSGREIVRGGADGAPDDQPERPVAIQGSRRPHVGSLHRAPGTRTRALPRRARRDPGRRPRLPHRHPALPGTRGRAV